MKEFAGQLAAAGIWVATLWLPVTFYKAWVATLLWRWFAVPMGLPVLSIWSAMGLGILVTMISTRPSTKKDERSGLDIYITAAIFGTLGPSFALLAGWIVAHFSGAAS